MVGHNHFFCKGRKSYQSLKEENNLFYLGINSFLSSQKAGQQ